MRAGCVWHMDTYALCLPPPLAPSSGLCSLIPPVLTSSGLRSLIPRYWGAHVNHAHEDQTVPLELRFLCEMLPTRWLLISRHFIWYLSISPPLQHIPELDIKINLQKCVPNTFCLMIKNLSKPGIWQNIWGNYNRKNNKMRTYLKP